MLYNSVIDNIVVTDVSVEPVSLAEAKQHMNMSFDTSGSYEFNDDDDYIAKTITQARDLLEQYTGLSFAPQQRRALLRNELSGVTIPFGPNISTVVVKDKDGNTLTSGTDYKLIGLTDVCIGCNYSSYLDITYNAGYAAGKLPPTLKRAILEEVEFRYNNRGSQSPEYRIESVDICRSAMELATMYKKTSWVV